MTRPATSSACSSASSRSASVVIADASAPRGNLTGEQVYGQVCKTCHEAGLAGAPKSGDKAAWTARIAEGEKTLVQHAVAGFQGKTGVMPPKGGNPDLTDDEVHRAVVYLANQVGCRLERTCANALLQRRRPQSRRPLRRPPRSRAHRLLPRRPPAAAAPPRAAGGAADGKGVYEKTCAVCHATGLAGAPKFGDKAAWAPRIATGLNTLHNSALHGKNAMPPKGGNLALTDTDVAAPSITWSRPPNEVSLNRPVTAPTW